MNRRNFLMGSTAATVALPRLAVSDSLGSSAALASSSETNVSVLLVDTDRVTTQIDERIYGHFLEHINHSVEDGLFAEQIRGAGFEGDDFKTYWTSFSDGGTVEIAEIDFQNGKKSVRLTVGGGRAGIRQGRLFLEPGFKYDGSLWVKREAGSPQLILHFQSSQGGPIASVPLALTGSGWQEVPFSFTSTVRGHASND
jgi:alpha-L-arabinofuranosidase